MSPNCADELTDFKHAYVACQQEEAAQREAELMEALAECQNMVDDLQQYSYDQGRDLAAAQTQLQVNIPSCVLSCAPFVP